MRRLLTLIASFLGLFSLAALLQAGDRLARFEPIDIFQLEYASAPQISPDGGRIVYVRNFMDIMKDRRRSNLWIIDADGSNHRPLSIGDQDDFDPKWSPDGKRLAYLSRVDGSTQLYCRWMDSGQTARLTALTQRPSGIVWAPDGQSLAFSMRVAEQANSFAQLPPAPTGAEWAEPPKVIRKLNYRFDGRGYAEEGYHHLFVVPAEGGSPRQITTGNYDHFGPPTWTPDGKTLIFSANRRPESGYDQLNTEIYEVSINNGEIKALTDRRGPDTDPAVSPDGQRIAYLGFDDKVQGYQVTGLYLMNRDGSQSRLVSGALDRTVEAPVWHSDGSGLFFQYSDHGNSKIGFISLDGQVEKLADDLGGLSIGRPYSGGEFSVATGGQFAFTYTRPECPADVAVAVRGSQSQRITFLNRDLFDHKELAQTEEIWFDSSYDGRRIQGWIVKPPGFDPSRKYPLLLEIHGGPFANYGDRFSAEIQLYAASGYVVFYANPRGSTSYGEEFGNLIHHAYPSQDYDDLMSGVDAVIASGYIDPDNLFVTGGSGGGVLTSWIVGKTDRFRAAVSAKPVINWYSFVLTSDLYARFTKYWFPGFPWDHTEHYMKRSPLSLVGNVKTPTMLLTGEADHRTPISESEQYYQALKLRKVDTALVRIPGASHGIASRPSQLMAKVIYILKWFEMHRN